MESPTEQNSSVLNYMKIIATKKKVLDYNRLTVQCPNCNKKILLDEDVFLKDPKTIACFACSTIFDIIKVTNKKHQSVQIELVKGK